MDPYLKSTGSIVGRSDLREDATLDADSRQVTAPLLSVVIASWNAWTKLWNCLTSIYAGYLPATEIIVVDNASSDGTVERLRQSFPQVMILANQTNIGHTRAINQGMSLARGEYILVLDDDTELASDCTMRLLDFMISRPDVAMVAPRTFNSDGSTQESARHFPGVLSGLFGRQSVLTQLFPRNRFSQRYLARDFLHEREPFEIEQIGAACMLFRREVLDVIGLWDERYVGYWVDTDWCRSARAGRLCIYCVPDARVTHHEGNARSKRRGVHRIWVFHRGAYRYYTKWHCRGVWDPRSVFAGLILAARAVLQIIVDATLKRSSAAKYKQIEIESVLGDS